MRTRTIHTLLGAGAFAAAALGSGLSTAGATSTGREPEVSSARKCSLLKIQVRPVRVFRVNDGTYEYRVMGRVYVPRPGRLSGCRIKVCEAEELGRGNWYPAWCADSIIARGERRYFSFAPYVDCDEYKGTGFFRSYARFEGSGVRAMSAEKRLCRRGKAVY
jgi:hypothetical protein